MAFREELRKRPRTLAGVAAVVILASAVYSSMQLKSGGRPKYPKFPDSGFYTVDDGATLFADSLGKYPPIDHNGQIAVRAYVFSCDGGRHQWVQYLEKYEDRDKQRLESHAAGDAPVLPLVKAPGKGDWVGQRDPRGLILTTPKCPDGGPSGTVVPVFP